MPAINSSWRTLLARAEHLRTVRAYHYEAEGPLIGSEHAHSDRFDMVFLYEGSATVRINDNLHPVQADDLLLIPPRVRHASLEDRPSMLRVAVVKFLCTDPHTETHVPTLPMPFRVPANAGVRTVLDRVIHRFASDPKDEVGLVRLALLESLLLLHQLSRHVNLGPTPSSPDWQMRLAARYLVENLASPITLIDLADHVGMSRSRFAEHFKRVHGVSPIDMLIKVRLERARALLEDSPLAIKEVARSAGFQSAAYFSRMFRKRYGHPPTSVRNRKHL